VEDPAADAEDHRPVAVHQRRERLLVLLLDVTFPQVPIQRSRSVLPFQSGADVLENHVRLAGSHFVHSEAFKNGLYGILLGASKIDPPILKQARIGE
jgi:hypothetical protein